MRTRYRWVVLAAFCAITAIMQLILCTSVLLRESPALRAERPIP